jgi:pimeloyl-ACP methyl ester carboxylesterase
MNFATSTMAIKRTNVRSPEPAAWKATSVRVLEHVSRDLAARWVERMFMRPPAPHRVAPAAQALFRDADHFSVELDGAPVRGAFWGDGPSVYLLHGWGGRATQLAAFVEPLVRAGFTAVAFDAPGHGASGGKRASLLHFARALAAVAERMGPARAVIGHSLGAAATTFAVRRGFDAERLVLIGAPADPSRYFAEFLRGVGAGPELAEAVKGDFARRYAFDWEEVPLVPARNLPVPALLIHDEEDRQAPYGDAEAIARSWPRSELMTTKGLGHHRILRSERVVARAVAWLAETISPLRLDRLARTRGSL